MIYAFPRCVSLPHFLTFEQTNRLNPTKSPSRSHYLTSWPMSLQQFTPPPPEPFHMKTCTFRCVSASCLHKNVVKIIIFLKWSIFETLRSPFPCKQTKSLLFEHAGTRTHTLWLQLLDPHCRFQRLAVPCKRTLFLKRFRVNALKGQNDTVPTEKVLE